MTLPFVQRGKLERALQASVAANERALLAEARCDVVLDTLKAERERYDSLWKSYLQLTMPAPAVPERTLALVPKEPREKDPVAEAIRAESGGDPKLAAHFSKYARELKRDGKTVEEIAALIGWTSGDPPSEATIVADATGGN